MKIGKLEIKNNLFLAPMAGVTDRAFRYMCKKYGVGCMTTEMVSAKAICFGDRKTNKIAEIYPEDRPCGLQLFGSEPEILATAASLVLEMYSPDFIDINMGCPAPKIVNNGEGSSLMKNPRLVYEIVSKVKNALDGKVPLTVKMRSGFDKANVNAVQIAEMCEKGGADAVFVHARTREQMYNPGIDLNVIRDVKSALSIPVIGNGDILSGADAKKMMDITGCDGVMVGRAALGNPYVFDEISAFFEGRSYTPPDREKVKNDVIQHISLLIDDKGEYVGVREARKHVAWYIKGMNGAAAFRNEVNLAESKEKMLEIVRRAFE